MGFCAYSEVSMARRLSGQNNEPYSHTATASIEAEHEAHHTRWCELSLTSSNKKNRLSNIAVDFTVYIKGL